MNDILARFLVVTDSEVDSYWMFVKYMDHKSADFMEDTMMGKVGTFILNISNLIGNCQVVIVNMTCVQCCVER